MSTQQQAQAPYTLRWAFQVIGVKHITNEEEILTAFRRKVKEAADGEGGYRRDMDELTRAKEYLLLALQKTQEQTIRDRARQQEAEERRREKARKEKHQREQQGKQEPSSTHLGEAGEQAQPQQEQEAQPKQEKSQQQTETHAPPRTEENYDGTSDPLARAFSLLHQRQQELGVIQQKEQELTQELSRTQAERQRLEQTLQTVDALAQQIQTLLSTTPGEQATETK
jgi:hypothetical protein